MVGLGLNAVPGLRHGKQGGTHVAPAQKHHRVDVAQCLVGTRAVPRVALHPVGPGLQQDAMLVQQTVPDVDAIIVQCGGAQLLQDDRLGPGGHNRVDDTVVVVDRALPGDAHTHLCADTQRSPCQQ